MNHKIRIPGTNRGFTLAEVLITLTIIGVIAALTIPALIQSIQDAQYRTAWRRADSMISEATRKLATDNGGSLKGIFHSTNDVRDKFSAYLSYTQKCDGGTPLGPNGCWNANIYNFSGNAFTFLSNTTMTNMSKMILTNGMFLVFDEVASDCSYNLSAKQNACAEIVVDVNGFKGPNTIGKDIYWGYTTGDGSFEPYGKTGDYWDTYDTHGTAGLAGCDLNKNSNAVGFTCSAQYLYQ